MAGFDFNAMMQDPGMQLGLSLLSQARTYGRPGSLSGALQQYQQLQHGQNAAALQSMQLAQLKRQQEEQERQQGLAAKLAQLPQQFMRPAVQGALEQGMIAPNLPIQSQQGQMLAEQMGEGGTVADLLALNQAGNYAQQGTQQEMPLQGRPAQMDIAGLMQAAAPIQAQLDPMGYFKGMQGQTEEARKRQEWDQYIANLPPEIRNNPAVMTVLGGGPELAGKLGPGVLPSVLKPREIKPLEGEQGRTKFKIFPEMTPEQAAAIGARYVPGVGGIIKGEKDKPVQVNIGGYKPQYDVELQRRLAEAKEAGKITGRAKTTAQTNLLETTQTAQSAIDVLDQMIGNPEKGIPRHPGFSGYVGGTWKPGMRFVEGSDEASYQALENQAKGGAFLEAYKTLKGGGQITEVEGKKATEAITRMNKAQSEAEYEKAALEYRDVILKGIERAKKQAGQQAPSDGWKDL